MQLLTLCLSSSGRYRKLRYFVLSSRLPIPEPRDTSHRRRSGGLSRSENQPMLHNTIGILYYFMSCPQTRWVDHALQVPESPLSPQACHVVDRSTTTSVGLTIRFQFYIHTPFRAKIPPLLPDFLIYKCQKNDKYIEYAALFDTQNYLTCTTPRPSMPACRPLKLS